LSAYEFLDALFATQSGFRPKDAFGFDGMRRQALALAPSPAFKFESLLFDTSLAPIVRNLNGIIREFESFRKTVMPEAEELATLQRSKNLAAPQRDRMRELQENPDVLFIKVFNEEHTKGVLREKKTSNAAAADALKKALPVYPSGDARRERFEAIAQRLRAALKDFDHRVDLDIASLSRQRPERELVYHTGDVLYLFLKGIGAANPKLRIVLSIRRQATPEASAIVEGSVGVVTRAFNDPPELNRQQNIVFASDYLRYWVSFFTQPVLVANGSLIGAPEGVAENRALIAEVPGSYIAVLELLDETTGSRSQIETKFSVVQ
jgi:hypothetical protein